MHIPNLVKIHRHLLKLSSGNKNMGMINAHTKFGENLLMFTQVIIRKCNTEGRMDTQMSNMKP